MSEHTPPPHYRQSQNIPIKSPSCTHSTRLRLFKRLNENTCGNRQALFRPYRCLFIRDAVLSENYTENVRGKRLGKAEKSLPVVGKFARES